MQVAIITKTREQVEIVAVNGGWTTVHTLGADTREMKVRNGALSGHTTLSDQAAALATAKAEGARVVRSYDKNGGPVTALKKAKEAIARAKKPVEDRLNGVVYAGYLPQYEAYTATLRDGTVRRSIDKGDAVATQLRGQDLATTYKDAAAATGLSVKDLQARFEHLNPGMQRMNLGNMIRRALREAAKAVA